MLKVSIYLEKKDFDEFFQWVNRLNQGILEDSPVRYSTTKEGFDELLHLSLEPDMYSLIVDAEKDLRSLRDEFGEMEFDWQPMSRSWELRAIKDIIRNAQRYDMESKLVYTALVAISSMPELTPSEAMIIAEREWLNTPTSA